MKKFSISWVLLFLIVFLSGCNTDKLETETPVEYDYSAKSTPAFLKAPAVQFDGLLFDLAAAPNDLFIADASKGIISLYGTTEVSLEGAVSVAPVGMSSMWAVTWPLGDSEMDTGQGLHQIKNKKTKKLANLFEFEANNNPDGQDINSNPYSVSAFNANFAIVADAGANDLLKIDNKGNIEVVAVFPLEMVSTENVKNLLGCPNPAPPCGAPAMIPAQPVPTSVVMGPDGYYYVGELKGFPAPLDESNIWKIAPDASGAICGSSPDCVKAFDGGFTSIIDLAFSEDGRLFVAEFDALSWFAVEVVGTVTGGNIKACNTETMECETIATGIPLLTAISFDKDGNLWAIKNGLIPGQAEVFKVDY
ncbi:ScyD/ScyE family protein [Christiangramia aestuarii]|nr:ScyD/ScyE family protein [Christiangramia aestuarii]